MAVRRRPKPKSRPTFAELTAYGPGIHTIGAPPPTGVATTAASGGVGGTTGTGASLTKGQLETLIQACAGGNKAACDALTKAGYNVQAQTPQSMIGGALGGVFGQVIPYLKIAAGGLIVIVSGLALVYVAGRNTGAGKAITGATGAVAGGPVRTAVKVASKVAPERQEARRIARATRTRERSERAASRVVTSGNRTRISSRRSGAAVRAQEAEYRSTAGTRQRERLGAFRQEQQRKVRAA